MLNGRPVDPWPKPCTLYPVPCTLKTRACAQADREASKARAELMIAQALEQAKSSLALSRSSGLAEAPPGAEPAGDCTQCTLQRFAAEVRFIWARLVSATSWAPSFRQL